MLRKLLGKHVSIHKSNKMKLSISQPAGRQNLLERLDQLTPQTTRKWGTMTVDQMLKHCYQANELMMKGSGTKNEKLKQKLIRLFFIKFDFTLPKNVKAPKAIRQTEELSNEFPAMKSALCEQIKQFEQHQFPEKMYHPAFGNLTAKEYGIAIWKHMDHHLRQFGV